MKSKRKGRQSNEAYVTSFDVSGVVIHLVDAAGTFANGPHAVKPCSEPFTGVNFTNILREAFMRADPKST